MKKSLAFAGRARRRIYGEILAEISFFAPPWRAAQTTLSEAYAKNPDDPVRQSTTVPEEVLQPPNSEIYWVPHPETGVFSPTNEILAIGGANDIGPPTRPPPGSGYEEGSSALDETVWFRPAEADEAPPPEP